MVGSKREYAINFITSNTSGLDSKSGFDSKSGKKESEWGSTKDTSSVNTSFKWTYGGSSVLLTGTFTGWKDHIPLQKVGNEFNTILRLPRGVYYYKFIVDGEWKFSPDDPTAPDEHGNINNVIDTTNIESMNKMMGSQMDVTKSGANDQKSQQNENPFTEEAPMLPPHLMGIYFLNEREKKIQDQNSLLSMMEGMDLEEAKNKNKENKSDLSLKKEYILNKNELAPPTHVTLNHLGTYNDGV
mmetsp:Transcript_26489/g.23453  ORF Transcript_26489/g.23453 Transcript_26489/m.23453 type:complete len:242 (-) Transcript_26489:329-1054(-)